MYMHIKYICAHQLCYGFNIGHKLETSSHENQNTPIIDDFLNFTFKTIDFKALFGTNI